MRTIVSYTADVAVRVVFTDDVADDARRLLVGPVPVVAELAHGVQHAPMHGLQTIAHVGQRAPDDDAHRVVEIRLAHLVFEIDRDDFLTYGHVQLAAQYKYGPALHPPATARRGQKYRRGLRFSGQRTRPVLCGSRATPTTLPSAQKTRRKSSTRTLSPVASARPREAILARLFCERPPPNRCKRSTP